MSKIDMSPTAITMRLERLSQMRELGILLKQAGQKAGLHNNPPKSTEYIKVFPLDLTLKL
jgi:hypothetical protein